MDKKERKVPVDVFYDDRRDFSIIGLTGMSGSGCSYLAEIASDGHFYDAKYSKTHKGCRDISIQKCDCTLVDNDTAFRSHDVLMEQVASCDVFSRKYNVCKKYTEQHYQPYEIIKYTHVLWLYTILYVKEHSVETFDESLLKQRIIDNLKEKYSSSTGELRKDGRKATRNPECYKLQQYLNKYPVDVKAIIEKMDLSSLISSINELWGRLSIKSIWKISHEEQSHIASFFFDDPVFGDFVHDISDKLSSAGYFQYCRYCHRLAIAIRTTGDPFQEPDDAGHYKSKDVEHLFDVAKLINIIIKGRKKSSRGANQRTHARIVIDALRNTMELTFFKERFTAFYSVAVHCDFWKNNIDKRVDDVMANENAEYKKLTKAGIKELVREEAREDDFEKGYFSAPDVSRCIAEAEIHLVNDYNAKDNNCIAKHINDKQSNKVKCAECSSNNSNYFRSLEEQWMKYASLILCPGLITPSAEERCMIVAYSGSSAKACGGHDLQISRKSD